MFFQPQLHIFLGRNQACVTHYIWVNRRRNHACITCYHFFHILRDSMEWAVAEIMAKDVQIHTNGYRLDITGPSLATLTKTWSHFTNPVQKLGVSYFYLHLDAHMVVLDKSSPFWQGLLWKQIHTFSQHPSPERNTKIWLCPLNSHIVYCEISWELNNKWNKIKIKD